MPIDTPHLIAPRALPDGRVAWAETQGDVGAVVTMLREYDPRCSLVRDNAANQWEVWRQCEDEEPRRLCSRPGEHVPNGPHLIAHLAKHDTRRGFDPIKDVDAANAAINAERDRHFDELAEDKADRLAHALAKDLDEPMPDGKMIRLGS